jgi:hypothetical protein
MMIFLSSMFPLLMKPMYHGSSRIFTDIFEEICVKTLAHLVYDQNVGGVGDKKFRTKK